jgi:hypothetical protein
MSLID